MRKDAWAKRYISVKVALSESITAELKFRRANVRKIGVKNSKGIEISNVMTSYLVCTN
jgi:hypothetical protein